MDKLWQDKNIFDDLKFMIRMIWRFVKDPDLPKWDPMEVSRAHKSKINSLKHSKNIMILS